MTIAGWHVLILVDMSESHPTGAPAQLHRHTTRGWLALPCLPATIAFNLTLAVLFCKSVNAVTPFYAPRSR